MKGLRTTVVLLTSAVCSVLLARLIDRLPVEMPALTGSAQFLIQLFDKKEVYNPDTVEVVSRIILFTICAVISFFVVSFSVKKYLEYTKQT